jgi:hypothetical protein
MGKKRNRSDAQPYIGAVQSIPPNNEDTLSLTQKMTIRVSPFCMRWFPASPLVFWKASWQTGFPAGVRGDLGSCSGVMENGLATQSSITPTRHFRISIDGSGPREGMRALIKGKTGLSLHRRLLIV